MIDLSIFIITIPQWTLIWSILKTHIVVSVEWKVRQLTDLTYPRSAPVGVKIDTNLSWQYHVNDLSIKLNRANALLFKMRKYVSLKILRSIYFAIFDSYLSYCCLVWAQNYSTIQCIIILQKKAIRIINLWLRNFHTSPLFKQNSILKSQDKIC